MEVEADTILVPSQSGRADNPALRKTAHTRPTATSPPRCRDAATRLYGKQRPTQARLPVERHRPSSAKHKEHPFLAGLRHTQTRCRPHHTPGGCNPAEEKTAKGRPWTRVADDPFGVRRRRLPGAVDQSTAWEGGETVGLEGPAGPPWTRGTAREGGTLSCCAQRHYRGHA